MLTDSFLLKFNAFCAHPMSFADLPPTPPSLEQREAAIAGLTELSNYWCVEPFFMITDGGTIGAYWRDATQYVSVEFYDEELIWAIARYPLGSVKSGALTFKAMRYDEGPFDLLTAISSVHPVV